MNLKYYLRGLGIGIIMTSLVMGIAVKDRKEPLTNEEIKERARALGMTEASTVLSDLIPGESASPSSEESAEPSGEGDEASVAPEESQEEEEEPSEATEGEAVLSPEADSIPSQEEGAVSQADPLGTPAVLPEPEGEETPVPEASSAALPEDSSESSPEDSSENDSEEGENEMNPPQADSGQEEATAETEGVMIEVVSGDTSYSVSRKLEAAGLITSADEYDAYICEQGYDKRINVGKFLIPIGADNEQILKIIARIRNE